MSLKAKIDAYKKDFKTRVPRAAQDLMHRATEDLKNSGIMQRTVKVGQPAPDFTLENTDGTAVSLSALCAEGPVVVTFYRGAW